VGPAGERPRRVPPAPLDLGAPLVARVVSIATDLMLASRVDAMLTAAGHHVVLARSVEDALLDKADLVVADLDAADPAALGALDLPVLGYYSHVDVETRKLADASGIDLAVPRSRMARELPALVEQMLSD
jgi:hypothetical protein